MRNRTVFDSRNFFAIDKSANKNLYLFLIYLGFLSFFTAVNYIFFQVDTKIIYTEYLHCVVDKFPEFFYSSFGEDTFLVEFIVMFIHNFFVHLTSLLFNVSFETSFLWGNLFYAFVLLVIVDLTAAKISESYFFRISAVFIFLSMPGNISGTRLQTVHYAEMVWLALSCLAYVSFHKKPSLVKALLVAFVLSSLTAIYRSGVMYALIVFAFFIVSVFFIEKSFRTKLFYAAAVILFIRFFAYDFCMEFLYIENVSTGMSLGSTLPMIKEGGFATFLQLKFLRLKEFFWDFYAMSIMRFYWYFFIYLLACVCIFRAYRYFPKKNISFYLLLLCLLLVPAGVLVFAAISVTEVAYPVYIAIYWFMAIALLSLKSVSRLFYAFNMCVLFLIGFWMLIGSSAFLGYGQSLYLVNGYSQPTNNMFKYRPLKDNPDILALMKYHIGLQKSKTMLKPNVSFVRVPDNHIQNIPILFFYLHERGYIKLRQDFAVGDADMVVVPFLEGGMPKALYEFGLDHYVADDLEKYQEFWDKKNLSLLEEAVKPYLPESLFPYRLKSVIYSPYGIANHNLMIKYYFLFTKNT